MGLFITPVCVHLGHSINKPGSPPAAQSGLQFTHEKSGFHRLVACRSSVLQLVGVVDLGSDLGKPPGRPWLRSLQRVCPLPLFLLACPNFAVSSLDLAGSPEDDPDPEALQT